MNNYEKKDRISTNPASALSNNPFESLDLSEIKLAEENKIPNSVSTKPSPSVKKGRVDLRREKGGRGGKTVTVLAGIDNPEERKDLLKTLQKHCGTGGTIKGELIEIQGDKRDEMAELLKTEGYRVVLSGG